MAFAHTAGSAISDTQLLECRSDELRDWLASASPNRDYRAPIEAPCAATLGGFVAGPEGTDGLPPGYE